MRHLRPFWLLLVLLAFTSSASAQFGKIDPNHLRNSPKLMEIFSDVVAKSSLTTVRVLVNGKEVAFGTIVEADGWIISKASELSGEITVKLKDGSMHDAKIVGTHEPYDLVMLKINATGLPTPEWRDAKDSKVGKWVASTGLDQRPQAVGVISVGPRKLVVGDQPPKITPLPNAGYLGVELELGFQGGAKIKVVSPQGPAEKAGLKADDVIVEAAGRKILDMESLQNTIIQHKAGDSLLFKVKRGEEELELKATLGKRDPKKFGGVNPQEFMGSTLSKRRGGFPSILQHDTVLKPGDCGGPLVDLDGKTLGINIARAGRTETYAIPSEDLRPLFADLKAGKNVVAAKEVPKQKENPKIKDVPKTGDQVMQLNSSLDKKDTLSKVRPGRLMKVHEVKLTAGATYMIEMKSSEVDPFLIIEDSNGKKVAEDDGTGIPHSRITFQAPADGTYRIIATSFQAGETGNYTLTVIRLSGGKK